MVGLTIEPVSVIPKVEDALREALIRVEPDGMVLVTGSLFIVGGVRDTWYNESLVDLS